MLFYITHLYVCFELLIHLIITNKEVKKFYMIDGVDDVHQQRCNQPQNLRIMLPEKSFQFG